MKSPSQTTSQEATHQPVRLRRVQDTRKERVHFQSARVLVSLLWLLQMLSLFGLASWASHKNKSAQMVSCEIVREKHVVPVLQTMSSTNPNWTDTYCNGLGIFKIRSN